MIYWRIGYPGKSWRIWQDGTADDVDEAQVEAMACVTDDYGKLQPPFENGVTVRMWRMVDIDDWQITKENNKSYRENYLQLEVEP